MNLTELQGLVERLWDKPDEEVRRELDAAVLGYFRRNDGAALSEMVEGWEEQFGGRHRHFEDALFAHRQGLYTLSIPALAAQVEGVLCDLTLEYGRGNVWIDRFNGAFGLRYDRRAPPPPPDLEGEIARFSALSVPERYEEVEESRRRFAPERINELYLNGEFSDPEFSSSVRRHAILHGVFDGYGELESLRLFCLLELLHDAVSEYKRRTWLILAGPSSLPLLRHWRASDLAFDGELFAQDEEAIDWNKVLRDLVARGLSPDGDEVDVAEVEATWRAVPALIGGRLPAGQGPHRRQEAQPSLLDLPDPAEYVQAALF
jgi:hypothetical protein